MRTSLRRALSAGLMLIPLAAGLALAEGKAPYPVGINIELTGRLSSLGIPEKRGADIAIDLVNAAGGVNGRMLRAVSYDNESDATKAVILTKKLAESDKVIAVLGYGSSGSAMAAIQTAESAQVPMMAGTAADKVWIPTKKWVFSVVPRQREASIPILLENLQQRGAKKIAFLFIDTVYGKAGKDTFDWATTSMNITPALAESYAPGTTDVGPQITHVKSSGADALLITGNLADTVMVIKNARDMGFTGLIVSDYAVVGPEFIELAGQNAEGIVTTSLKALVAADLSDSDPQKAIATKLYKLYTQKHGAFSLYAGHTWDQVFLLTEALKKVDPNLDPAKEDDLIKIRAQIRDNLEGIKGFVGQNGIFNYSADNHNGLGSKCYTMVVVDGGKWKMYKGK